MSDLEIQVRPKLRKVYTCKSKQTNGKSFTSSFVANGNCTVDCSQISMYPKKFVLKHDHSYSDLGTQIPELRTKNRREEESTIVENIIKDDDEFLQTNIKRELEENTVNLYSFSADCSTGDSLLFTDIIRQTAAHGDTSALAQKTKSFESPCKKNVCKINMKKNLFKTGNKRTLGVSKVLSKPLVMVTLAKQTDKSSSLFLPYKLARVRSTGSQVTDNAAQVFIKNVAVKVKDRSHLAQQSGKSNSLILPCKLADESSANSHIQVTDKRAPAVFPTVTMRIKEDSHLTQQSGKSNTPILTHKMACKSSTSSNVQVPLKTAPVPPAPIGVREHSHRVYPVSSKKKLKVSGSMNNKFRKNLTKPMTSKKLEYREESHATAVDNEDIGWPVESDVGSWETEDDCSGGFPDKKWCRTCATERNDVILILGKMGLQLNLLAKINSLVDIGEEPDILPMQMCNECISQLDTAVQFVQQIKRSEKKLKEIIHDTNFESDFEAGEAVFGEALNSDGCVPEYYSMAEQHGNDLSSNDRSLEAGRNIKPDGTFNFNELISCNFCFAIFRTEGEANEHEKIHSQDLWPLISSRPSCEYCLQLFNNKYQLDVHQLMHHNSSSSPEGTLCETCGKLCANQIDQWKHCLVDHPKDGPLECSLCSQIYPSESKLRFHIEESHSETLQTSNIARSSCSVCGILVFTECLDSHMNSHNVSLEFTCNQCERSFDTKLKIEQHIAFHTRICPRCDKRFSSSTKLERHLMKHEIGSYPCLQCGASFYTSATFERHQLKHKQKSKHQLTFSCQLCDEVFTKGSLLWDHQKTHTRAERDGYYKKLTQCDQCEQCFISSSSWQIHVMLKHRSTLGDFRCIICNKDSETRQELKDHLEKHRERHREKDIKCDKCGMILRSSALRSHMSSAHSGDPDSTRYMCHLCGLLIRRIDNFRKHLRVHNGEKPYRCMFCEQCFSSYNTRITHMNTDHSEVYSNNKIPRRRPSKKQQFHDCHDPPRYEQIYRCYICEDVTVFHSYSRLRTHVINSHPTSNQAQLYKESIRRSKQATKSRGHKCHSCSAVFRNYDTRRLHVIKMHPDSDKAELYDKALERLKEQKKRYKHKCNICDEVFDSHYKRRTHVIRKHPDSKKASEYRSNGTNKKHEC